MLSIAGGHGLLPASWSGEDTAREGKSLGRTEVVDEPRQIGHLIENSVIPASPVKKQHMQWSEEGAHNLLQVRTRVLNNDLRRVFDRWYPTLSGAVVDGPLARKAA